MVARTRPGRACLCRDTPTLPGRSMVSPLPAAVHGSWQSKSRQKSCGQIRAGGKEKTVMRKLPCLHKSHLGCRNGRPPWYLSFTNFSATWNGQIGAISSFSYESPSHYQRSKCLQAIPTLGVTRDGEQLIAISSYAPGRCVHAKFGRKLRPQCNRGGQSRRHRCRLAAGWTVAGDGLRQSTSP